MKITRRQLKRIIREAISERDQERYGLDWRGLPQDAVDLERADNQQVMIPINDFQEAIEWGEWPGRPPSFEWDYVEQEGPQDLRFDWRGGSMWYRAYSPPGEVEGNIPKHLIQHLKKMGLEVYPE